MNDQPLAGRKSEPVLVMVIDNGRGFAVPPQMVDSGIRVLLADDHLLFRKGLRAVLDEAPGIAVVAEAGDGDAALAQITAGGIDVAVLDLDMPHQDGIQVARAVRGLNLPVRMILLTAHKSDALVNEALDAGVLGYILKDGAVSDILDCVRRVHAGHHYVSPPTRSRGGRG